MRLIIKDKEGNSINKEGGRINSVDLDKDIAKLWNKKLTKQFANPTPEFTNPDKLSGTKLVKAKVKHNCNKMINWYDFIKYSSDTFPEGQIQYKDLMNRMFTPIRRGDNSFFIDCEFQIIYNKPYFDVLEMWFNKGYTIHNIL